MANEEAHSTTNAEINTADGSTPSFQAAMQYARQVSMPAQMPTTADDFPISSCSVWYGGLNVSLVGSCCGFDCIVSLVE